MAIITGILVAAQVQTLCQVLDRLRLGRERGGKISNNQKLASEIKKRDFPSNNSVFFSFIVYYQFLFYIIIKLKLKYKFV